MAQFMDCPNEVLLNILAPLAGTRSLMKASNTCHKLRACASELHQDALRLDVETSGYNLDSCPRCLSGSSSTLTLPASLPILRRPTTTSVEITSGDMNQVLGGGYHFCQLDLSKVLPQFTRLQYLAVQIPLAGLNMPLVHNITNLSLDFQLTGMETPGVALSTPLSVKLTESVLHPTVLSKLHGLRLKNIDEEDIIIALNKAIHSVDLIPGSLNLECLEIEALSQACVDSIVELLQATKALKMFKMEVNNAEMTADQARATTSDEPLFRALVQHKESLETLIWFNRVRRRSMRNSSQIGGNVDSWDLSQFPSIHTAVLPFHPFGYNIDLLPPNVQLLQLQEVGYALFEEARKLKKLEQVWNVSGKAMRLSKLAKVVWWNTDLRETDPTDVATRPDFVSRWGKAIRAMDLKFEFCQVEMLEGTPVGRELRGRDWIDGGVCGQV